MLARHDTSAIAVPATMLALPKRSSCMQGNEDNLRSFEQWRTSFPESELRDLLP
jgi:hypothetical protein